MVARLKDASGETVLTLSQQYILTGTDKELDAAKEGEILFYRQADLPPGVYGLEAIVFDALAERGSARLSTINVPAASRSRLAASSLVLVRRTEQVPPAERAPNLPFYYGDRLLYPNTGEPLRRGTDAELMFYICVLSRRGRCRRRDGGDHEQRTHSGVDGPGDAPGGHGGSRPARRDTTAVQPPRGHLRAAPPAEPGQGRTAADRVLHNRGDRELDRNDPGSQDSRWSSGSDACKVQSELTPDS